MAPWGGALVAMTTDPGGADAAAVRELGVPMLDKPFAGRGAARDHPASAPGRWAAGLSGRTARHGPCGRRPPMPVRVLVVDDDPTILELVMALEDEGYEVATASNGREALDRTTAFAPEVILLDMNMPVMDGAAFTAAYRAAVRPPEPAPTEAEPERSSTFAGCADRGQQLVRPRRLGTIAVTPRSAARTWSA